MLKDKLHKIAKHRDKEYGSYQDNALLISMVKEFIYFDFKYVFDGENYIMPIKLFRDYENTKQKFILKQAMNLGKTMMALKAIRSIKAKENLEDSIIDFVNYHNLTQQVFEDNKLGHMSISFDECIFNPILNDGINTNIEEISYLVNEKKIKDEFNKFIERNCNE